MQAFLSPANFAKAQRAGVFYASKAVPPTVAKGIGAAYNLKAARIKQDIYPVRIDPNGESATIRFSRRPPSLIQYGARPGTRGHQPGLGRGLGWGKPSPAGKPVTATILRADGRNPIKGGFIITGASGNQVVVRRTPTGKLVGVNERPSVGSIFLGKSRIAQQLQADVQARINEQFIKGFERQINAAARGYG